MMAYHQNLVAVLVWNGEILRELENNTVLVPFGAEYQLRFKNKDSRKAVVEVEVDGRNATEFGGIIVGPNETVDLEGWMDRNGVVPHKFKFIQKTKEIKDYRGDKLDDGLIVIKYRFEKQLPIVPLRPPVLIRRPWYPGYKGPYRDGFLRGCRGGPSGQSIGGDGLLPPNESYGTTPISMVDTQGIESRSLAAFDNAPLADEGITVEGSHSSQSFGVGTTRALEEAIHTISFKLLGRSLRTTGRVKKAVTVKTKITCNNCGRKNKPKDQFCGGCGTAVLV